MLENKVAELQLLHQFQPLLDGDEGFVAEFDFGFVYFESAVGRHGDDGVFGQGGPGFEVEEGPQAAEETADILHGPGW